ncbi:MAG TPA: CotH kinase family protein, partial [Candidatus Saccharimonadales bacterium]|nr:CotH kinase family protein [Candidatus Saccharimonadales bacterium]
MNRFSFASTRTLWGFIILIAITLSALPKAEASPKDPILFSVPGGVYTKDVTLKLSAGASPGVIRYTLDESEPTEKSPQFSEPLVIINTTVVKAKIYPKSGPPGPTSLEVYTMVDATLAASTSNLPMVLIHNVAGRVNSRNAAPCFARVFSAAKGRSSMTGQVDFEGLGTIKRRGRSSLEYPKNSFTLHTVDSQGEPLKAPILGMPKESAWVLYAPYPDKTLMRDALAYKLSNEMGRYAPRTRFVELYVSRPGTKVTRRSYAGVYVLLEKIKRDKNRVNIAKLTPEDKQEPEISGGYIFKKDHSDKGDPGFTTSRGNHFYYDTPKAEEITSAQRSWLVNYLNRFESALYGPKFRDPEHGYAAYVDTDSLIDQHWIVELSKNIDGIRFSNFMHKDRGGKIKMEPIWDWNLSFGNAWGKGGYLPEEWYSDQLRSSEHLWFPRLFEDPDFQQKYI